MNEQDPPKVSMEEALYGSEDAIVSGYRGGLTPTMNRMADVTGISAAESEEMLIDTALTFHDASISATKAAGLHDLMVKHVAAPADDATQAAWAVSSRTALRERFGADAERRVGLAQQFIAARPAFARMLTETGLGSHPDIVGTLAENAGSLRVAPRRR